MLRAKSIPAFLEQANTDGMRATMLLQVGLVGLSADASLFLRSTYNTIPTLPPSLSLWCLYINKHVRRKARAVENPQ